MIILDEDILELEYYLEVFRQFESEDEGHFYADENSVDFFSNRPHLILSLGFDETRALIDENQGHYFVEDDNATDPWVLKAIEEAKDYKKRYGLDYIDFTFGLEYVYRHLPSGAWYWFEGLSNDKLLFHGPKANSNFNITTSDLYKNLKKLKDHPDSLPRTIWLPGLWLPYMQYDSQQNLSHNISDILGEIYKEKKELSEISPRQLEEIIAELLKAQGMQIHLTPITRDGGRDIIARGELIPGQTITLAIEVKHKKVVGIQDLNSSLKANEDFPALLLATTGRFSAGVIKEKQRERHQLRLILKDGVALSQWIDIYGKNKFGK